jgi:hypothetical protein
MNDTDATVLLPACPFLPGADPLLSAVSIRAVGNDRGEAFYRLALTCAQALWQKGLPAQAILMLNRAFSADLGGREPVLGEWPPPYRPLRWILEHRREGDFVGNPRRHFQHLATRMSGPRSEVRTWRAWACWSIACLARPDDPADERQIAEEGIVEPDKDTIRERLAALGWEDEGAAWEAALGSGSDG